MFLLNQGEGAERGLLFGRYRYLRSVGRSECLFLATDLKRQRRAVIRILPTRDPVDPFVVRAFRHEVMQLGHLRHPHVVRLYAFGRQRWLFYVVMEHIEGPTLAEHQRRHGPPGLHRSLEIVRDVASGLRELHAHGIVHGALSADHVMLDTSGNVRLIGFGGLEAAASPSKAWAGVTGYRSPEQMRGDFPDTRTDVWALGALLHELITGSRPRKRGFGRREAAADGPHSRTLAPLLHALLQRDAAHRPRRLDHVLDRIDRLLVEHP